MGTRYLVDLWLHLGAAGVWADYGYSLWYAAVVNKLLRYSQSSRDTREDEEICCECWWVSLLGSGVYRYARYCLF